MKHYLFYFFCAFRRRLPWSAQCLVLLDQRYPSNYTTFGGQNLLSHLWRPENRFLYSRRPTSRCNDFYKKNLRTARQRVKNLPIFLFEISFNTFPLRPSVPSHYTHLMMAEAQRAIRRRSARVGKQVPVQHEKKTLSLSVKKEMCNLSGLLTSTFQCSISASILNFQGFFREKKRIFEY